MNLGIATAGVGGALLAGGPIVEAVRALYGMGVAINDFVDTHIDQMKKSENPTICRTGFVLEAAKNCLLKNRPNISANHCMTSLAK
jgi:hypothetical protein